jgi:phosphate:Na+ symporter
VEFSWQEIFFAFLGGLGLFLFGLRFMSDALQSVAGNSKGIYRRIVYV